MAKFDADKARELSEHLDRELSARGLNPTKEDIAAIVGNLAVESFHRGIPFNTRAEYSGWRGIAQWDKSRWGKLEKFAKERKASKFDLATQAAFIAKEMATTHKHAWNAIKTAKTVNAKAKAVRGKYEVAVTKHDPERVAYSKQALDVVSTPALTVAPTPRARPDQPKVDQLDFAPAAAPSPAQTAIQNMATPASLQDRTLGSYLQNFEPVDAKRAKQMEGLSPQGRGLLDFLDTTTPQGFPGLQVTSAQRSKAYNSTLKGAAPNSAHIPGHALDLKVKDLTPTQKMSVLSRAIQSPQAKQGIGVGFYGPGGHLHVDVDPSRKGRATWGATPGWAKDVFGAMDIGHLQLGKSTPTPKERPNRSTLDQIDFSTTPDLGFTANPFASPDHAFGTPIASTPQASPAAISGGRATAGLSPNNVAATGSLGFGVQGAQAVGRGGTSAQAHGTFDQASPSVPGGVDADTLASAPGFGHVGSPELAGQVAPGSIQGARADALGLAPSAHGSLGFGAPQGASAKGGAVTNAAATGAFAPGTSFGSMVDPTGGLDLASSIAAGRAQAIEDAVAKAQPAGFGPFGGMTGSARAVESMGPQSLDPAPGATPAASPARGAGLGFGPTGGGGWGAPAAVEQASPVAASVSSPAHAAPSSPFDAPAAPANPADFSNMPSGIDALGQGVMGVPDVDFSSVPTVGAMAPGLATVQAPEKEKAKATPEAVMDVAVPAAAVQQSVAPQAAPAQAPAQVQAPARQAPQTAATASMMAPAPFASIPAALTTGRATAADFSPALALPSHAYGQYGTPLGDAIDLGFAAGRGRPGGFHSGVAIDSFYSNSGVGRESPQGLAMEHAFSTGRPDFAAELGYGGRGFGNLGFGGLFGGRDRDRDRSSRGTSSGGGRTGSGIGGGPASF